MERRDAECIMIYYKEIPEMIENFCREKNEIEEKYYNGNHAMDMDGMPHGSGTSNPTAALAVRAAENSVGEEIDEINTRLEVLCGDRRQIRAAVNTLNNRYKNVLIGKYVNGDSWTELSLKIHASTSTIRYWRDKALDRLNLSMQDEPMIDELVKRASRAR
ncbi:MAG: hypothetical protein K6G84_05940 [Lachnospiraceae bacterium]|nr:hypothetical protein [Lachnospiraceae bacterium]